MSRSSVWTSVTATGWPSTVTVTVAPSSAASAFARSSASLVPPQVSPANVLHSVVHPVTKIFVPRLTVHNSAPLGPNGATTLPSSTTQVSPPGANGFWGVGVSRTVVHNSPSVPPGRLVGAAPADDATKQEATAARS